MNHHFIFLQQRETLSELSDRRTLHGRRSAYQGTRSHSAVVRFGIASRSSINRSNKSRSRMPAGSGRAIHCFVEVRHRREQPLQTAKQIISLGIQRVSRMCRLFEECFITLP